MRSISLVVLSLMVSTSALAQQSYGYKSGQPPMYGGDTATNPDQPTSVDPNANGGSTVPRPRFTSPGTAPGPNALPQYGVGVVPPN